MSQTKQKVVLSLEQALSMSYATLRFVHLGWRVIRLEATPVKGRATSGDPNRYIGKKVAGKDRHSYYIAPNAGKEAIAIDLKQEQGQALLKKLIKELSVDVFCTNTMPSRHIPLGIDYNSLKKVKEDLIWCGISALGTEYPKVPGYDPMLQAMCGYMDLTGYTDGPPLLCGPPIIDLKAGDEAFTQVILALMEKAESKNGKMIDISMAQAAISWLHTFIPMLNMGSNSQDIKRSGNEHRQFIPVNAYPANEGFIYIAIGSDAQWNRFIQQNLFKSLNQECYTTNENRRENKEKLHKSIAEITSQYSSNQIAEVLAEAGVPNAPITKIEEVMNLYFMEGKSLYTTLPDGKKVTLPPPAVNTPFLEKNKGSIPIAPGYGANTELILREAGFAEDEIKSLYSKSVVA